MTPSQYHPMSVRAEPAAAMEEPGGKDASERGNGGRGEREQHSTAPLASCNPWHPSNMSLLFPGNQLLVLDQRELEAGWWLLTGWSALPPAPGPA